MIVSAHLLPHSPILLPSIGKEERNKLKKIIPAIQAAVRTIKTARPDTIVFFGSHGAIYREAFSLHLHDPYVMNFHEFGEFATELRARPDLETGDRLKRALRGAEIPFTLDSDPQADYGTGVAYSFLAHELPSARILPLRPSALDLKRHHAFGVVAHEIWSSSHRRIALVVNGDLSHRLESDSPGGFAEEGKEFDLRLHTLLKTGNFSGILTLEETLVANAGECVLRPLLMMLGSLSQTPFSLQKITYEAPFGVGLMVAEWMND